MRPDLPVPRFDPLRLLDVPRTVFVGIGVTLALVGSATLIRLALGHFEPKILVYATFYPAVLATTLIAGPVWGSVSVSASAALGWFFFMEPEFSFAVPNRATLVNVPVFLLCSGMLVVTGEAYLRLLARLQEKRAWLSAEKEKVELLARELQHRSKNSAAVIASIVRQSLRGDKASADRILGRLSALEAGDLLLSETGGPVQIKDIIERELSPYDPARWRLTGAACGVPGPIAKALGMVVHELATNAAKYGALSGCSGLVTATWTVDDGYASIVWNEAGGPVVETPDKFGFGTLLIERLLNEHGGGAAVTYHRDGVCCRIELPTVEAHEGMPVPNAKVVALSAV